MGESVDSADHNDGVETHYQITGGNLVDVAIYQLVVFQLYGDEQPHECTSVTMSISTFVIGDTSFMMDDLH